MKKAFIYPIVTLCTFLLTLPLSLQAQDAADTLRTCVVHVVNNKGKALSNIILSISGKTQAYTTDLEGKALLEHVRKGDTLLALLPVIGETAISLSQYDSLRIIVRSDKKFRIKDLNPQKIRPSNAIEDVPAFLQSKPVNTLAELLIGAVAGLTITSRDGRVSASMRGQSSINSSTEPIVVVDGMVYDDLATVNGFLNVHSIQRVEVLKDGGLYGIRGANGVIVIQTIGSRRSSY